MLGGSETLVQLWQTRWMTEAYEDQLPLSKGSLREDRCIYTYKKKIFDNEELSTHWEEHKNQCPEAEVRFI